MQSILVVISCSMCVMIRCQSVRCSVLVVICCEHVGRSMLMVFRGK